MFSKTHRQSGNKKIANACRLFYRPSITMALCLVIFLSATDLHAAPALPEFKARYAIEKYGIKLAEAVYQLSYTESGYKFTQNTRLVGIASMFRDDSVSAVSFVDRVDDKLLLRKYSYVQTGKEKNKDEDFSVRWDTSHDKLKGEITGIVRGKHIKLETSTPVWEVLSFQIPLMIEANERQKEYIYKALLGGELDNYDFVLNSSKTFPFAGEDFKILQLIRTDPKKDRQLHIWLAPELHNMPVIIENYRDGKEHSRMQLESVQFNSDTPINDDTEDNDDF